MNVKILIATHKKYWMPQDNMYLPIHVGREGKGDLGYIGDNTGDNISLKNPNYCELTGIYWAWKNLHADYIGLAHYRRHFSDRPFFSRLCKGKLNCILRNSEVEGILAQTDVILPKPRNYFIETNWSQYVHAHHEEDLVFTRNIISDKYPAYLPIFDAYMKKTVGHRFNMFIMKKDLFDSYCAWLFDILFQLEQQLDISKYSANDARVFGFVSERLLDIWLEYNKVSYKEMNVMFMEKQNWIIKGGNFLKRKFL